MQWSFWLYLAAWAPFTGCLLLYGLGSPWWTSSTGRALISLYAALVGVLSLVLAVRLFDLPPKLLDVLRVLTLGAVAFAGMAQLVNIVQLQHRRRREPDGIPRRRRTDR